MNSLVGNQNVTKQWEYILYVLLHPVFLYYSISVIIAGLSVLPYAANVIIYALENLSLKPGQTGMPLHRPKGLTST